MDEPVWFAECIKAGKPPWPLPNLTNALVALRNDEFADALGYDEMLCAPTITMSETRVLRDDDIIRVQEWMQRHGLTRIGKAVVEDAVFTYCRERCYHPVRDYLESLEWDGQRRTNIWLVTLMGCEPTRYHQEIGEMFLISMVARIFEPGCKHDHIVVLEGPQGSFKSTACRVLGGEYFSDALPDISSGKDVSVHLMGKWLVEVAELDAISRAKPTALNSFLTRTHERFRPPYGRLDIIQARQCVFVGTSNHDSYWRDETGARRVWPVKTGVTGPIDINRLRELRDQLFAEAVHLYNLGKPWWPDTAFEAEHIRPKQEEVHEVDDWITPIADDLDERCKLALQSASTPRVTTVDLAQRALRLEPGRIDKAAQMRIAAILRTLGWVSKRSDRARWWEPMT